MMTNNSGEAAARTLTSLRAQVLAAPRALAPRRSLGEALLDEGLFAEAADVFGDLMDLVPADPFARLGRARARYGLGDLAGAEEDFRSVQRIDRANRAAALGLARARRERGDLDGALVAVHHALRLSSADLDARALLGWIQHEQGDDGAIATFRTVLWSVPGHPEARAGMAAAGARDADSLLADTPPTPSVLVERARRATTPAARRAALQQIVAALADKLPAPDRARLLATQGDLHDALGEADRAMVAWTAANHAVRVEADLAAQELRNVALEEVFSAERVRSRPTAGPFGGPVLVVGAAGSGAGLLRRLLAAHPAVAAARAQAPLHRIAEQLPRYTGQAWPDCVDHLAKAGGAHLGARWQCDLEQAVGSAQVVLDATPTRIDHLGLAALLAPGARVVVVRRNGWDAALSAFRRPLRGRDGARSRTLAEVASARRQDEALLQHWQRTLPLQFHEVDYDELVAEPGRVMARLWGFLGLPLAARNEALATASSGRWYRYARWIAPLTTSLAA